MTADLDKSSDSRARILEVAKPLFVERGYRGLSMRELGEAVGLSKAAIYYHFRDKEALFGALLDESLSQLASLIDAAQSATEDPREQVISIVRDILALPMEERSMIRLAMQEMAHMSENAQQAFLRDYNLRFLGRLQEVFSHGIAAGRFRKVAPETATWTLLGMMYPYFYATGQSHMRTPGEVPIDDILAIFFDGVCV